MKIFIAGALGYDGAGLIEIYRNRPEDEVILLDNRFVPNLIANLPANIKFIEGDIRDKETMDRVITDDIDILYLLAGEVEAERSVDKEKLIWDTNYHGAVNIIERCGQNTRVVFASSCNVFGGVSADEKNMDLNEEDEPKPKLPYAESKREVEKYLLAGDKNYTIVRFGTHFGYTPGIRFNLVTNIFFKKAMMGQDLTVYGTGSNYRPTLCAKDAIRGVKFLAEHPDAGGEIFHLVGENYRIRELAELVASLFPGRKVNLIDKVVPFNSYNVSAEKVKKLGFTFDWTIPKALEEMKTIFASIGASR